MTLTLDEPKVSHEAELPAPSIDLSFKDYDQWVSIIECTQRNPEGYLTFYPTLASNLQRAFRGFKNISSEVRYPFGYEVRVTKDSTVNFNFQFAYTAPPKLEYGAAGYYRSIEDRKIPSFSVVISLSKESEKLKSDAEYKHTIFANFIKNTAFQGISGNTYAADLVGSAVVVGLVSMEDATQVPADISRFLTRFLNFFMKELKDPGEQMNDVNLSFSPPKIESRNLKKFPLPAPHNQVAISAPVSPQELTPEVGNDEETALDSLDIATVLGEQPGVVDDGSSNTEKQYGWDLSTLAPPNPLDENEGNAGVLDIKPSLEAEAAVAAEKQIAASAQKHAVMRGRYHTDPSKKKPGKKKNKR